MLTKIVKSLKMPGFTPSSGLEALWIRSEGSQNGPKMGSKWTQNMRVLIGDYDGFGVQTEGQKVVQNRVQNGCQNGGHQIYDFGSTTHAYTMVGSQIEVVPKTHPF